MLKDDPDFSDDGSKVGLEQLRFVFFFFRNSEQFRRTEIFKENFTI